MTQHEIQKDLSTKIVKFISPYLKNEFGAEFGVCDFSISLDATGSAKVWALLEDVPPVDNARGDGFVTHQVNFEIENSVIRDSFLVSFYGIERASSARVYWDGNRVLCNPVIFLGL